MADKRALTHTPETRAEWLLNDPALLGDEVWQLFEIEGTSDSNLAAIDKYTSPAWSWHEALITLSAQGHLDRQRLLDASLQALARDFPQFRAGWFSRFHEGLEPTVEERLARTDAYLTLIGSPIPPTAAMALGALLIVDKHTPLLSERILPRIRPILLAKAKGTVKKALQWLNTILKRDPGCSTEVSSLVLLALRHESIEIQECATAFLEQKHVTLNAAVREDLRLSMDFTSASVQPRLKALCGVSAVAVLEVLEVQEVEEDQETNAASSNAASPLSRLDAKRALQEISTLEDLLQTAAMSLENLNDFQAAECVMHALLALPIQRDASFLKRTAPLQKRAKHLLGKTFERSHAAFFDLLLSWISPAGPSRPSNSNLDAQGPQDIDDPEDEEDAGSPVGQDDIGDLWENRVHYIREMICSGHTLPLPGTPTHRGGWIDPIILVARIGRWKQARVALHTPELCLALLRLAPENRKPALDALDLVHDRSDECLDALRYSLGATGIPIGENAPLWVAAVRSRDPEGRCDELEKVHPGLGPDAAEPARFEWKLTKDRLVVSVVPPRPPSHSLLMIPVALHKQAKYERSPHLLPWAATIWPARPEAIFARGPDFLFGYDESDPHANAFLTALMDPFVPPSTMALLTLVTGLGCRAAELRASATDAFVAMIDTGRIVPESLGAVMSRFIAEECPIPLQRWAKSLSDAARISLHHGVIVRKVLEAALVGPVQNPPRDMVALLELLSDLVAQSGEPLTNDATRTALQSMKASGRTRKLIDTLLGKRTS